MAKRFKLGICRVITTTLDSCRSKDPSNLPQNPVPSFSRRHNPKLISAFHFSPPNEDDDDDDDEWHVVAKIYGPRRKIYNSSSSSSDDFVFDSQLFTTSTNLTHKRNINKNRGATKRKKSGSVVRPTPTEEETIPARFSMLKKMIPCAVLEGKVKESYAIVKRSKDPYHDFKNSMMDMILENQMFEAKDLEQLLQCLLSLNSRRFHGIIVQAFSQIWESYLFLL